MTLTPVRKRLQLSNVSDSSTDDVFDAMDVDSPPGARSRSVSSPFMSPLAVKSNTHAQMMSSPMGPPAGSSPTTGLKRHGFMVVRKRRSTFNDRLAIRKKRTSSPLRPITRAITPDDYILKEDNLCSTEEATLDALATAPIIKRPTNSVRRSLKPRPMDISNSPVSVRPFRTVSLCSPPTHEIRSRTNSLGEHQIPIESVFSLNPLMDHQNMTGDFKRQLALPIEPVGKHSDLKYISAATMVALLDGNYPIDFEVIDARYPYEYQGGHIKGAKNLYTKDQLYEHYFTKPTSPAGVTNKKILIFHCEFSSERAPSAMRYLRKCDRARNRYPKLDFPEIYILKGGYKELFLHFGKTDYITPTKYTPMLDTNFVTEFRHFRRKCKTLPAGPNRQDKFSQL